MLGFVECEADEWAGKLACGPQQLLQEEAGWR